MTRFPLMELSPPLFPDLLDDWKNTVVETHVFSGPSTHRRVRRGYGSDHRSITVLWNDPKWDFPDSPRKRWTVQINHYINTWTGEGRKSQHHFRSRHVSRDFNTRAETVEFAIRLLKRLESVERKLEEQAVEA